MFYQSPADGSLGFCSISGIVVFISVETLKRVESPSQPGARLMLAIGLYRAITFLLISGKMGNLACTVPPPFPFEHAERNIRAAQQSHSRVERTRIGI